jgi:beta-N-acetylhexosaminidase
LLLLGFNINFAPVVDVIDDVRSGRQNGLHTRNFGTTAAESLRLASAFLTTLQEHGCIGCIKHFPGLGAAVLDSHETLPEIDIDNEEFENIDLLAYRRFIGNGLAHVVMIAHALYPGLHLQERDQSGRLLPSSLSPEFVTGLLRDELGFAGVAISDDLEMGAIIKNYGIGEACVMAVSAGMDMLAICASPEAIISGHEEVFNAVEDGRINERRIDEAVIRIHKLSKNTSSPPELDLVRLRELDEKIALLRSRL